jgi:peroxiredoxin
MRKILGITFLIALNIASVANVTVFLPSLPASISAGKIVLPSTRQLQSLEDLADNLFMASGPVLDSIATLSVDQMKACIKGRSDKWTRALSHTAGLNTADKNKAIAYGNIKILICKTSFAGYNLMAKEQTGALTSWLLEGQDLNDPALATFDPGLVLSFVGCFLNAKEQEMNKTLAGNNTAKFNKYKYLLASSCSDPVKQRFLDQSFSYQFRNNYCSPELSSLVPDIHKGIKDPAIVYYFDSLLARYHELDRGQPAPDFTLMDCNGRIVKLSDFRGKKLVIEVWSTSCYSCLKAMPVFDSLVAANDFPNTVFVKYATDQVRDKNDVTGLWREFIVSKHLDPATNLIALGKEQVDAMMKGYAIGALGHYYVIDKDGKIVSLNHFDPLDPELFKDMK